MGRKKQTFSLIRKVAPMYPTTLCRELCNKSSAVAEMGDRLATIHMGRKVGTCCASFSVGELGPHLGQCPVPLLGGAGSPSERMWPGLRPTSVPCGILEKSKNHYMSSEIWRFFRFFQDDGPRPCWIRDARVWTTHNEYLVVLITVQNLVGIGVV